MDRKSLGLAAASGPQVVIGSKKQYPSLPSTSQKNFFVDPDADIASHRGSAGFPGTLINAEEEEHFEYGKGNRLGTQQAYKPVPHTCTMLCMPLYLPHPSPSSYGPQTMVCVPPPSLGKNSLAFTLRLDGEKSIQKIYPRSGPGCTPVVGLETLNYLLMGIQVHKDKDPLWKETMWEGLDLQKAVGWAGNLDGIGNPANSHQYLSVIQQTHTDTCFLDFSRSHGGGLHAHYQGVYQTVWGGHVPGQGLCFHDRGWRSTKPLQHLVRRHAEVSCPDNSTRNEEEKIPV